MPPHSWGLCYTWGHGESAGALVAGVWGTHGAPGSSKQDGISEFKLLLSRVGQAWRFCGLQVTKSQHPWARGQGSASSVLFFVSCP